MALKAGPSEESEKEQKAGHKNERIAGDRAWHLALGVYIRHRRTRNSRSVACDKCICFCRRCLMCRRFHLVAEFRARKITVNMFRLAILVAFLSVCSAAPYVLLAENQTPLAHPAVLANDAEEAALPDHLKNDFYKNPHIVAALAEPSWFGYKEAQVTHRETDHIPREKVFHLLHNAGLARR